MAQDTVGMIMSLIAEVREIRGRLDDVTARLAVIGDRVIREQQPAPPPPVRGPKPAPPVSHVNGQVLLNDKEVARRLSVRTSTLAKWRLFRKGPKFVKVGKLVRYPEQAVTDYLSDCEKGIG